MATLFTFGDSFSESFHKFYEPQETYTTRNDYIHNFLGGRVPKIYSEIIAEKLGFDLVNRAASQGFPEQSNCNESMFNNFYLSTPEMKEGDIVILQYTNIERVKWACHDKLVSMLPNESYDRISSQSELDAIHHYQLNKSEDIWYKNLIFLETFLLEFAKSKKLNIFFWTYSKKYYWVNYDYIKNNPNWLLNDKIEKINKNIKTIHDILINLGGQTIDKETKGLIWDSHYGETAHTILGDLFYEDIMKKINNY